MSGRSVLRTAIGRDLWNTGKVAAAQAAGPVAARPYVRQGVPDLLAGGTGHAGADALMLAAAQVRIPSARLSTPIEDSIARHEFPGHSTDAGQKRRSRSEAGPVQHGNAPRPAKTACLSW